MSVFLDIQKQDQLFQSEYFFVIKDRYPVSPGHCLIISKAVKEDFFALSLEAKQDLLVVIDKTKEYLEKEYHPHGYNIGMNCGAVAGQTVFHFHCHVIPRFKGDMADPRGGVRHCIQGKGYY